MRSDQPMTVGALKRILEEFHESDLVVLSDWDMNDGVSLWRFTVQKRQVSAGTRVVFEGWGFDSYA
jgi:hypothetical protein